MPLFPQQSFEHTLREISVNRNDPCEIVRELVSNSYDARAKNIYIVPLYQQKGLLYIDDGCGLSETEMKNGVLPYVAFFSIGKGTKTPGEDIGYKCQGSKLCFASRRFSLITRCDGENDWRWISVRDPKTVLNETFQIDSKPTKEPWNVLKTEILTSHDNLTRDVLEHFSKSFFQTKFSRGLVVVVEDFEVDDFDKYFSVSRGSPSYLREYIRFYTAHADVRRISRKEHGFRSSDVNQLKKHVRPEEPCELHLWSGTVDKHDPPFEDIVSGWPYLPIPAKGTTDSAAKSPEDVFRLRDGAFFARHADSFKFEGRYYNLILAIDGKRRALDLYPHLARQGKALSCVKFGDQRGVILCSQGVRVCQLNQLLEDPGMNGWDSLIGGVDHFCLFIDGPFELVTNRNQPAQSAISRLRSSEFVKHISAFLNRVSKEKGGEILRELANRIRREATAEKEEQYTKKHNDLKSGMAARPQFRVEIPDAAVISEKWFVAPLNGEEHLVGALYTLFSTCVPETHPLKKYWHRGITFKSLGIDALAVTDEDHPLKESQFECVEYKHTFSSGDEYNHPLTITDRIVCWALGDLTKGETIVDSFGYQATVDSDIIANELKVGCVLSDVRHKDGGKSRDHSITVLSLDQLLEVTFKMHRRSSPKSKGAKKE